MRNQKIDSLSSVFTVFTFVWPREVEFAKGKGERIRGI